MAPFIEPATAQHLNELFLEGAPVIVYGEPPARQPGFWKSEEMDIRIQQLMVPLHPAKRLENPEDLLNYLQGFTIRNPYHYESNYPFLRHHHRKLNNGDRLIFYHNLESEGRFFRIQIPDTVQYAYWINPLYGDVRIANAENASNLRGFLEGYGSTFLYCTQKPIPDSSLSVDLPDYLKLNTVRNKIDHPLENWSLWVQTDERTPLEFTDSVWFDWRRNRALAFSDHEGVYSARFFVQDTLSDVEYMLDLGKVYHAADIYLNTELAGSIAFPPFILDISDHIVPGWNQVEIWVTPNLRNAMLFKAYKGNEQQRHLLAVDLENLEPAGLLGPVRLWELIE